MVIKLIPARTSVQTALLNGLIMEIEIWAVES